AGPERPEPSPRPVDAHAADFLADLIEPGVVLVPTAPLTNLALMLERHPDVPDRLERLRPGGGGGEAGDSTAIRGVQPIRRPGGGGGRLRERDPEHDGRARRDPQGALHARARGAAARRR